MKILVISDIHGDIYNLNKILDNEEYDHIFILGDLGFNKQVINRLNEMAGIIDCVKGNCDGCVLTNFEIPLYKEVFLDNKTFMLTHGHQYNENSLNVKQIYIQGHTHKSCMKKVNNKYYLNPGSISLPRTNNIKSYIIIDNNTILLKEINNKIMQQLDII